MFEVGDLVRVTEAASSLSYVGVEGTVQNVIHGRLPAPDSFGVTIHTTHIPAKVKLLTRCYDKQSLTFWTDFYSLELVNNEPPVCEDWS